MTEPEIRDWLEGLARTDAKRIAMLREMIDNANEDMMSVEDRTICVSSLAKLEANKAKTPSNRIRYFGGAS